MAAVQALMPVAVDQHAHALPSRPHARRVSWLLNRMKSPKYSDWRISMEQPSPKFVRTTAWIARWISAGAD